MSPRSNKHDFASRPGDAEHWVKTADMPAQRGGSSAGFTARLTIDVTPELRGRIKIAAFQRGTTVADLLRDLLGRTFPSVPGDAP